MSYTSRQQIQPRHLCREEGVQADSGGHRREDAAVLRVQPEQRAASATSKDISQYWGEEPPQLLHLTSSPDTCKQPLPRSQASSRS